MSERIILYRGRPMPLQSAIQMMVVEGGAIVSKPMTVGLKAFGEFVPLWAEYGNIIKNFKTLDDAEADIIQVLFRMRNLAGKLGFPRESDWTFYGKRWRDELADPTLSPAIAWQKFLKVFELNP